MPLAPISPEVVSDSFHGCMLQRKSAMMHMGRFVAGLGEAAARRGAVIFERAPVALKNARAAAGI